MRKRGETPQGFESFHSDLTQMRWHNLVCRVLWMINSIKVGPRFIVVFPVKLAKCSGTTPVVASSVHIKHT